MPDKEAAAKEKVIVIIIRQQERVERMGNEIGKINRSCSFVVHDYVILLVVAGEGWLLRRLSIQLTIHQNRISSGTGLSGSVLM